MDTTYDEYTVYVRRHVANLQDVIEAGLTTLGFSEDDVLEVNWVDSDSY